MMGNSRTPKLIAIALAAVLVTGLGGAVWYMTGAQAHDQYQAQEARLRADLRAAADAGFTAEELSPITSRLASIQRAQLPVWAAGVMGAKYNQDQYQQMVALDQGLKARERLVTRKVRDDNDKKLSEIQAGIGHAQQMLTPDSVLAGIVGDLAALQKGESSARGIKDLHAVGGQVAGLRGRLDQVTADQTKENAAIQQAASALGAQAGGNVGTLQNAGNAALAGGRNDATVAAYEAKPGRFPKAGEVNAIYQRLEYYGPKLTAGDAGQVAFAAAALQRYAGQIHQLLIENLGPKHIIVSFQDQHVWAYENGKVVMDTPATTGIWGNTDYGTDFGPMKMIWKDHPHKMHSPYPQGSPHWYPDTMVEWASFFTNTGESIHDASWEPDSQLGPGSQYDLSTRSHGCVHVPLGDAQMVFNWADIGTPVDVYPGDGSPVAQQLTKMTTNDQGVPNSNQ
jgi:lipoprotein-anchoring transpeptidase ErfK/SrfK